MIFQSAVGAVLTEGARLLNEGVLQPDEEAEVKVQMRLLNSRWEALRLKAMDIQVFGKLSFELHSGY